MCEQSYCYNLQTEFDDNEDWDNWTGDCEEDEGPHCDDPNFNVMHQELFLILLLLLLMY